MRVWGRCGALAKGRPADPTRARRGTGHRRNPTDAVVPSPPAPAAEELPPAPEGLPESAGDLWAQTIAELWPRGLRHADLEGVRMMVTAAHRNRQAAALVDAHGLLVTSPTGQPVPNPALKIEKDTRADFLRLADAFGLTLAARLRLGLLQLQGETLLQSLERDLA